MITDAKLNLIMPITLTAHHRAQQMIARQKKAQKARQVYLNTLATHVVSDYLNALGIATNLAQSDSEDLICQTLLNTGALQVENWGQIECRPVLPGDDYCYVPSETWHERQGYIAVEFNHELTMANLRGYLPIVNTEYVELKDFEPIEALIATISRQSSPLSQWLNNLISVGWETLDQLFDDSEQLALEFRSATAQKNVQRGKWIHLERDQEQVAILIELAKNIEPDLDISVQVYPQRDRILPNDLKLFILDAQGEILLQAASRESGSLVCDFSGQVGEVFGIKLKLGGFSLTEEFLI